MWYNYDHWHVKPVYHATLSHLSPRSQIVYHENRVWETAAWKEKTYQLSILMGLHKAKSQLRFLRNCLILTFHSQPARLPSIVEWYWRCAMPRSQVPLGLLTLDKYRMASCERRVVFHVATTMIWITACSPYSLNHGKETSVKWRAPTAITEDASLGHW